MGRPKKPIDYDLLGKLAYIQCTQEELASVLGVSVDTIQRDAKALALYHEKSRAGRMSLRRFQFQAAEKGDRTMLVWLGKQYLGQTDRQELTGAGGGPVKQETIIRVLSSEDEEKVKRLVKANA